MASPKEKKLTPMLAQYRSIKSRYPDAVVLFRLGDFYEMFEADAKIGARELELAPTVRSFAKGVRLAMAGVPHHHVQSYIAKLIERGYKVACGFGPLTRPATSVATTVVLEYCLRQPARWNPPPGLNHLQGGAHANVARDVFRRD